MARLEFEKSRADSAEQKNADLTKSREEWKAIADKEKLRADTLEVANMNRQNEVVELRTSRDFLRQSVAEYKEELNTTRRDLERARSAQKWYAAGGVLVGGAAGYGICRAAGR